MKTSVLIIAHNEERYIAKCIESVLHQTKPPDEVVLVVHNSTDKTLEIVRRYPVTVVPFEGKKGLIFALLKGFEHISGDIILCLDGDSYAHTNWVEVMSELLQRKNNVLVGSWVKFRGTLFGNFYNVYSKYAPLFLGKESLGYWIWGPSFAFWGKDKEVVKEIISNSPALSAEAGLPRNPDDYWRSLFMGKRGNLERTSKTWVCQHTKETNLLEMIVRRIESHKNKQLMDRYFKREYKDAV